MSIERIGSRLFAPLASANKIPASSGQHCPGYLLRYVDLQPMPAWQHMERAVLQVRSAVLGHGNREIGVGLSPDQLDRNIESLQFGQARGVPGDFVEELRRHLRECRAGTWLFEEVVGDQRIKERFIMRLLALGQNILESLLLPIEQPTELLRTLQNGACERLEARGGE